MDGKEGDGLKLEKLGGLSPQPLSHIASCVCVHIHAEGAYMLGGACMLGGECMLGDSMHTGWVLEGRSR